MATRALSALHHSIEATFVTTIEQCRGIELVRRCPDVADLVAAAAAGLADVAFVSSGLRMLDRDVLAQLDRAQVHVIGVVDDESDERVLRQLGITRVVQTEISSADLSDLLGSLEAPEGVAESQRLGSPVPDSPAELTGQFDVAGAADRLTRRQISAEDEDGMHTPGRIIAVWGPHGAPGRTTVAVNLAAALAPSHKVLLIDADTWGACVAQTLAIVDEAPGFAAACRAADQGALDRMSLARLAPMVPPGFRVLTGLPRPDRWPELRPPAVSDVLRVARTIADVVIVDCGFSLEDDEELSYDTSAPRRNGATLTVLAEADEAVVVGAADPIGLQRLVRAVQDLAVVEAPPPAIIVNKVRQGAVGTKPQRTIAEALARFSGLDELTFLPWDLAAMDAAVLAGQPVVASAPAAELSKALIAFSAQFAPVARSASTEPSDG